MSDYAKPSRCPQPHQVQVIAGLPGERGLPTKGPAAVSKLHSPTGVAVDDAGSVYIADAGAGVIEKITPDGTLQVIAGLPGERGLPTKGPAAVSKLHSPTGVAVDDAGSVYIADAGAGVIEKITPDGTLQVIAGRPGRYWPPVQGRATKRHLQHPSGVAVDNSGNVYVADASGAAVVMITPEGMLLRVAGQLRHRAQALRGAPMPGPAQMSSLYRPCSIAVDQAGNTLTVDPYSGVIVEITPQGTLSLAADIPNEPWMSMPATVWAFEAERESKREPLSDPPVAIAVDAANIIYVADSYNAAVQKLIPLPPAGNQTDPG